MGEVKKKLVLKGLSCANCAKKIEDRVGTLEDVKNASINFADSTLSVELASARDMGDALKDIKLIVKDIEAHVEVIDNDEKTNEDESEKFLSSDRLVILFGIALYAAAIILKLQPTITKALYLASYLIIGGSVLSQAVKNITKGEIFDENFLMSIATIGAFIIGEYTEAVAVMLFYRIGEEFQDAAVNRSRASIKSLMNIKPDRANLLVNGEVITVNPEDIELGDTIVVRPGERVPLDAKIIEGFSDLDTSALTGESLPQRVSPGDSVLSGSINGSGVLTLEVTKIFTESTVSRILELVENSSSKKAATEQFITRFAKIYTPIVVFMAVALAVIPPLVVPGATFSDWLYRALIFLVISCPCALVISIPLSFFGGIGSASRKGILVKGGNSLEALHDVNVVVFDKTGTITKGEFEVSKVIPQPGFTEEELIELGAYAEYHSNHPIGKSVIKAYTKEIAQDKIKDYSEVPGRGVKAVISDNNVLAGSIKLLEEAGIVVSDKENRGTGVYLAVDGQYAGRIEVTDTLKEDSKSAVEDLRKQGISNIIILSGDRRGAVERAAEEAGIDEYYYELLPHQKVEKIEELMQRRGKGKVAFAGDGLNDAPVLARADVGVAMGGIGSDTAIEAADVVLMTDEPSKMAEAISIARKTRKIVMQNIGMALVIKIIVLGLGTLGMATMWEAVFADVGATLLSVFNSMRILRK